MATVAKHKHRKKHFKKQKLKLFRANESVISVFMWGVNHTIKEMSYIRIPLMLMPDDFKAYSKVKIDNHLYNKDALPSHFKVKEYCPMVFRRIRERFGIDDKEYANSLCLQQPVRVEDSGRSRARFLQSFDRKFVIKTLQSEDIAEMHSILPNYHQYVIENGGRTLLPQYIGMYRLTLNNVEHYVIVTRNVMSSTLKTHKKYDLKGSTVQREASEKEKTKEFPTFKDNDFVKDNVKIYMDRDAREDFLAILKRDVEFLASLKLMDYSLLVGIHDKDREDRYNDELEMPSDNGQDQDGSPLEDDGASQTPPDSPGCFLRQDSQEDDASDIYRFNSAENSPKNVIYFMGLIDILTHYDAKKKAAHAVKTAKHWGQQPSGIVEYKNNLKKICQLKRLKRFHISKRMLAKRLPKRKMTRRKKDIRVRSRVTWFIRGLRDHDWIVKALKLCRDWFALEERNVHIMTKVVENKTWPLHLENAYARWYLTLQKEEDLWQELAQIPLLIFRDLDEQFAFAKSYNIWARRANRRHYGEEYPKSYAKLLKKYLPGYR